MFIDMQTQTTIHADLDATVIHATLRPQDLIPAFMTVIKDTAEYVQIMNFVPAHATEDDTAEYWDSEDCSFFLQDLFDTLNNYAPDGYYFGSHGGDGSDFGYWKIEADI